MHIGPRTGVPESRVCDALMIRPGESPKLSFTGEHTCDQTDEDR